MGRLTYNLTAIDAYDEVVPGFNGDVLIFIAEDLKTGCCCLIARGFRGAFGVKARNEAIKGAKHCCHYEETGWAIN